MENNNTIETTEIDISEQAQIRLNKLIDLKKEGKDPYHETVFSISHKSGQVVENYVSLEGKEISIAGRIMTRRIMGKASFCHIQDSEGQIQSYVRVDALGESDYEEFLNFDIGDIVGIHGEVFKTQKGEVSVKAKSVKLLSKSLLPLPEKFHGLKDNDLRYRQRYLDLIMNGDVKNKFKDRSLIIKGMREYLENEGFIEVETPVLDTIAGGASARPFTTHHNTLNLDMFLRIAPELYLKRLIVGGFDKVYELGRMFRNEGMSYKHNPEFTMMELYSAYTDYHEMMRLTEGVYDYVMKKLGLPETIPYGDIEKINMKTPFARLTMKEAVKKYAKFDIDSFKTAKEAVAGAKKIGVHIDCANKNVGDGALAVPKKSTIEITKEKILYEVFDQKVESQLIDPVFITEYPLEVSPLAKKIAKDPLYTYRFELFIAGREMGNAYSELNDPIDQKERFAAQQKLKEGGDAEAMDTDDDFVNALSYAMPPTGGLGLGIDRMVMLLTNSASIREVILFPTMKPKTASKLD